MAGTNRAMMEAADRESLAQVVKELEDENDAIRRCVALEGEESFYKWFNDDEKVPPFGERKERTEMIERRIEQWKLMAEHKESVANEKADGEESQK